MRAPISKPPKGHTTSPVVTGMFHGFGKVVAVAASTGAAIVSIISALYSYGMVGDSEAHQSFGNLGSAWVRLQPNVDSATAIGESEEATRCADFLEQLAPDAPDELAPQL